MDAKARIAALVNDDLMNAYAESVKALGTPDLVLFLDEAQKDLQAMVRAKFVVEFRAFLGTDSESELAKKLERPATSALKSLAGPLAFWFVVFAPDDEMICVAIGGSRLPSGAVEVC